jgi:hypothetical protein
VTFCEADGNGVVGIAPASTRKVEADVLLELDSRDRRSRTTCGVSRRCVRGAVRPLRYALSLVRCGDGDRWRSRTLSFFERTRFKGGVNVDVGAGAL